MALDMRTLILLNLIGNLIGVVTVFVIWKQYRRRYPGIGFWLTETVLQALAIGLIMLRGWAPDFWSMVVANVAVQTGLLLLLLGLGRFFGRPRPLGPNLVFLGAFALVFSWWALVDPQLAARDILLSFSMTVFMAQVAWFLLFGIDASVRRSSRMTALVALGFVLVNLIRMATLVVGGHPSNDFFHAGNGEGVVMLVYVTLSLLLVVSLVLLVTQRLLGDVQIQEEKFSKAFHAAPYAVLLTRARDGTIFEVNHGFAAITGFTRTEALGRTTTQLQIWTSDTARGEFLRSMEAQGRVKDLEMTFVHKSGAALIGLVSAEMITINQEPCVISCISDITEQSRLRQQLQELATHDALTGLPNRRLFSDRFEVALSNACRNGQKLAVMSLDLDHFKQINDGSGHEVGDAVLVEAGRRLLSCLRRVDTVARFGGDEFVLLLWEVEDPSDAADIAQKILELFRSPLVIGDQEVILNASIGIALYPDDGDGPHALLKQSDEALYAVKAAGRNHYRFAHRS